MYEGQTTTIKEKPPNPLGGEAGGGVGNAAGVKIQQRKDTIFYIPRAAQNSIFQHLPFNFARHSQRAGLHFVIYNSLYIKQAKKTKNLKI
jgi:hypothetical protein